METEGWETQGWETEGWDDDKSRLVVGMGLPGEPAAPTGSRFYGADAPRATPLRWPETAPASGTMVPSAQMAKPSRLAANQ